MNLEPELKFRVAKRKLGSLPRLRISGAHLMAAKERYLISTYFDTPKGKLATDR
jgi:inorganic triphosphatase YgiF